MINDLNRKTIVILSMIAAALIWLVFSWPLPRCYGSGLPASSTNIEKYGTRFMVNGDHLQLHYFYWLFGDMVKGGTPWFHNLYEFNTGIDAERYSVGNYNIPFSLIYVFWELLGSPAFAWNMLAFTTLWLTLLASWLLLRRYTDEPFAAIAALIAITLPYRYIALFGGSPMGHAMLWPPLIVLGLDLAVRNLSFKGGLMAALVLLSAYYNDTRVFLFSVLTAPLWCFLALIRRRDSSWRKASYWSRLAARLLPFAFVVLGLILAGMRVQAEKFSQTALAGGREIGEVAQFSPEPSGLLEWFTVGKDAHAFIGMAIPLLLMAGLLAGLLRLRRRGLAEEWRDSLSLLLLTGLAAGIVLLALGPNGPFGGFFYMQARRFLPAYDLMRMTAQVYCILPTTLALAGALALSALARSLKGRRAGIWTAAVLGLLLVGEHALQVRTTVCRLPSEQAAYRAVARQAEKRGQPPRAMIIPVWPGDSSWSAIYMHYASLYRIRMINGYSPQVKTDYIENIFSRLGRSNIAVLPDENLDFLRERGIDYIILHEDAFPEKVSPFPVCFTIKGLLEHPRLELLAHEGSIWSFRILNEAAARAEIKPGWDIFFPALHWELEHSQGVGEDYGDDHSASGGRFARLDAGDDISARPFKPWGAPRPALLVRLRGEGVLSVFGEQRRINSKAWNWKRFEVPGIGTSELCETSFAVQAGDIDLDAMLYISGEWPELAPGESLRLPAALFFHAGCIDLETDSVLLRRDYEPDGAIFYGPELPLPRGSYELRMEFASAAAEGTRLGRLCARIRGDRFEETPAIAGRSPALIEFEYGENLPFRCEFRFKRNADTTIRSIVISRKD